MRKLIIRLLAVLAALIAIALAVSYQLADGTDRKLKRPVAVSATPFVQRDIVVNGLRLRYIDEGAGPVLVFVPGLTSRIEEYDRLTAAFRGHYRVLVLDFPGSGYADKPVRQYSVAFYVATLAAFLDALHVRECFLAGGSLGGNVVLRAARAEPRRVRAVAAWGPGSAWEAMPKSAGLMSIVGGKALFWPTVLVQSRYWHSANYAPGEAELREQFRYYREIMSPGFIAMYWGLAADQIGSSLFPTAPEISQPVLLLWGDQDHGLDMGAGTRRLVNLLPHAEMRTIQGSGHAISSERPAELEAALQEFFARQPISSAP